MPCLLRAGRGVTGIAVGALEAAEIRPFDPTLVTKNDVFDDCVSNGCRPRTRSQRDAGPDMQNSSMAMSSIGGLVRVSKRRARAIRRLTYDRCGSPPR